MGRASLRRSWLPPGTGRVGDTPQQYYESPSFRPSSIYPVSMNVVLEDGSVCKLRILKRDEIFSYTLESSNSQYTWHEYSPVWIEWNDLCDKTDPYLDFCAIESVIDG